MAEQQLNRPNVGAGFEQMDRERVSERMRAEGFGEPGRQCASWHARSTAPLVMGVLGSSPGKSQCWGRRSCHHARRISSRLGESITYRSCWPLPCSTRMTIRWLSTVDRRWTASEMRRPAA